VGKLILEILLLFLCFKDSLSLLLFTRSFFSLEKLFRAQADALTFLLPTVLLISRENIVYLGGRIFLPLFIFNFCLKGERLGRVKKNDVFGGWQMSFDVESSLWRAFLLKKS
jgi:hypothetical protein